MDPITWFMIATAACEFWHQVREPLLQLVRAMGGS